MISVTIINKNGERHLKKVLEALQSFDEVLLYDSGSTDASIEIGKLFPNVTLVEGTFEGFGQAHNNAAKLAKHPWILSIDSDEVLSSQLIEEIQTLSLDPRCVYSLPFHNYFKKKWIKWCGWYPESHVRLYHRDSTSFTNAALHEGVVTDGMKVIQLKHPVNHYSYQSISDFLTKMERYSTLFAKENVGKKYPSVMTALGHGAFAFIKSYFLKRGFLGGVEGFVISCYNGETAFYKYLKLRELNNTHLTHVPSCGKGEACKCRKHPH
ncbi:MAG: hypothetical protein S4CHLAM45_12060 [Chlamydiales bacterium]|nr:hypothetical protein [Chlamydiales bacterium]MCH9619695.1 hypothetical protein [Chlamydiales bacterium]MCH9623301.1 hypothetical protein [Chlamydiales bacterium]